MTQQATMSFFDHLGELRSRVIKCVVAILVGSVVAFFFNEWILEKLAQPYIDVTGEGLAFFRPTEAFSLVMKLSLFGGVIIASPVIIYQLWRFVSPALTKRERRYLIPLSTILAVLFAAGVALGYWSLERGLSFLIGFGGPGLEAVVGAEFYLSFAMRFILAFGLAFEFPVFLFTAAAAGLVTSAKLRAQWRWVVLGIVVGAALMTPSGDPLTLTLLSAPLYVLFELTLLAIKLILKR
ncbi:MAG TPA: twin-arginine translocase subunit TatC [Acidimicrobiia bacterium]